MVEPSTACGQEVSDFKFSAADKWDSRIFWGVACYALYDDRPKKYTPNLSCAGFNFMNLEDLYYRVVANDRKFYHAPVFLVLRLVSFFYGWAQIVRAWCYRLGILRTRKLACRVISVGNLIMGGTGKTPMTLWIAEVLRDHGYKPAILSRGYGGLASEGVHVVCDGQRTLLSPEVAGDEPYMMAERLKSVPILTSRDRYEAGRYAIDRFGVDTLILDDGFQHLPLHRDVNILLCDQREPFGNGLVFPAGHLREPLQAAKRADLICVTRCSEDGRLNSANLKVFSGSAKKRRGKRSPGKNMVRTRPRLDCLIRMDKSEVFPPDHIRKRKVAAFCGIARPESFREFLKDASIVVFRSFPDHYSYTSNDLRAIEEDAKKNGAEFILVTEKDAVKIMKHSFEMPVLIVRITLEILEGKEVLDKLLDVERVDIG